MAASEEAHRVLLQTRYLNGTVLNPFGPENEVTRWTFGATFGADIIVEATRHVSVVPQVRVLTIARSDASATAASYTFGLSAVVYRAGIGVRVAF